MRVGWSSSFTGWCFTAGAVGVRASVCVYVWRDVEGERISFQWWKYSKNFDGKIGQGFIPIFFSSQDSKLMHVKQTVCKVCPSRGSGGMPPLRKF